MKKENETGSSLIEVMGVIAVVGVITVGLYSGIESFYAKFRISRLHDQTRSIIKNVRDRFAAAPLTSDPTAETLFKLGIFDNVIGTGTSSSSNNVAGHVMKITIPSASAFAKEDKTFKLTYSGVNYKMCIGLLTADWGTDPSSGLAEISTGADNAVTFQWPRDYTTGHHPLPITMDDAITECDRADPIDISWEYYF